jgi:hypothetical protein
MLASKDGFILNHPLNHKISSDNGYTDDSEICPEESGGTMGEYLNAERR